MYTYIYIYIIAERQGGNLNGSASRAVHTFSARMRNGIGKWFSDGSQSEMCARCSLALSFPRPRLRRPILYYII